MPFRNLNLEEFEKLSKETPEAVVIDCRTQGEINYKSLDYNVHLDITNPGFLKKINELDKSKHYFVYCASGSRSSMLCSYLERQGFKNIYNLSTGIM